MSNDITIPAVADWIDKNIKHHAWKPDMTSTTDGSSFKEMNWFFKMNDCFSVAELQDSLFSSAYSHSGGQAAGSSDKWDSKTSPVQLCNNALSNFGQASGVPGTTNDLNAIKKFLEAVSAGGNSDIALALSREYPGAQLKGLQSQLGALSKTLSPDLISKYGSDLNAIQNPTIGIDSSKSMNNIKSISGVISGLQNLFTGASQAASMQMKSLQAAQNAIMSLLEKLMSGDHNTFKTMISNMNKQ